VSAGDSKPYPANKPDAAEALHDAVVPPRWLVEDRASPEHIAIMRAMTGQKRLQLAEQMFWEARELTTAGIRRRHPGWGEREVRAEVDRIFLHGTG
jgi:hypothetical protein